jgi:2-phosphoglycerate kinase
MSTESAPPWTVLLLGGGSGTGKTRAAQLVAARFGVPWLQLDDIRLALQHATTPEQHAELHYFLANPSVWERPEEELFEGLKAVARVTSAALEAVVAHHLSHNDPVVIEGDGILPRMAAGTHFAGRESAGSVRAIFLVEPREEDVLAAFQARGPRGDAVDEPRLRTQARVAWRHGQWVQQEALTMGLPVVAARPYERVAARLEKELR